eukprot:TRINITY_DN44309_c0_g1_i1.p1 TRINITY_DN44309_c0_g1~~TRINITY_DN44309_c0_g1_i1.p1  ORF type:complete len:746 (+),score=61.33 TRINITY_DN44309_c0_g1_i1:71-2239(+)
MDASSANTTHPAHRTARQQADPTAAMKRIPYESIWAMWGVLRSAENRECRRHYYGLSCLLLVSSPRPQCGDVVVRTDGQEQRFPNGIVWSPGVQCTVLQVEEDEQGMWLLPPSGCEPVVYTVWTHYWAVVPSAEAQRPRCCAGQDTGFGSIPQPDYAGAQAPLCPISIVGEQQPGEDDDELVQAVSDALLFASCASYEAPEPTTPSPPPISAMSCHKRKRFRRRRPGRRHRDAHAALRGWSAHSSDESSSAPELLMRPSAPPYPTPVLAAPVLQPVPPAARPPPTARPVIDPLQTAAPCEAGIATPVYVSVPGAHPVTAAFPTLPVAASATTPLYALPCFTTTTTAAVVADVSGRPLQQRASVVPDESTSSSCQGYSSSTSTNATQVLPAVPVSPDEPQEGGMGRLILISSTAPPQIFSYHPRRTGLPCWVGRDSYIMAGSDGVWYVSRTSPLGTFEAPTSSTYLRSAQSRDMQPTLVQTWLRRSAGGWQVCDARVTNLNNNDDLPLAAAAPQPPQQQPPPVRGRLPPLPDARQPQRLSECSPVPPRACPSTVAECGGEAAGRRSLTKRSSLVSSRRVNSFPPDLTIDEVSDIVNDNGADMHLPADLYSPTTQAFIRHARSVQQALGRRFQAPPTLQAAVVVDEKSGSDFITWVFLLTSSKWTMIHKQLFGCTFARQLPIRPTESLSRRKTVVIVVDGMLDARKLSKELHTLAPVGEAAVGA